MAIVGLDGNDAPELIEGVPARLWMGIQARVHTAYRREINQPDFALGLIDALTGIALTEPIWRERVRRSFDSLEGFDYRQARVIVTGTGVELNVEIDT